MTVQDHKSKIYICKALVRNPNNEPRVPRDCRSNLSLAPGMIMLSVFPMLLVIPMWHLRRGPRRVLMQQRMLRRREMGEMMNLMRYGAASSGSVVTVHDGHRMALVRRLLAVRQLAAGARHLRPPDPRGGQHAGAEAHYQSQDEQLQQRPSGDARGRGRFRGSKPRLPAPPFVEGRAGEANYQGGVKTSEYADASQQLLLPPVNLGRGRLAGDLALRTPQRIRVGRR